MTKAKLKWITFDLGGWRESTTADMNPDVMQYFTKEGEILRKVINHVPSDFPQGIDNIRKIMHDQVSQNGVMISCDIHDFGQVEGVVGIFKSRTPDPTGFRFSGSIIICYRDFFYSINIQAEEQGITGIRESVILDKLKITPNTESWFVHPYGKEYNENTAVKYNLSYNADYDEKFPRHPLSQVRATINSVVTTLSFTDDLKYCESYPLK